MIIAERTTVGDGRASAMGLGEVGDPTSSQIKREQYIGTVRMISGGKVEHQTALNQTIKKHTQDLTTNRRAFKQRVRAQDGWAEPCNNKQALLGAMVRMMVKDLILLVARIHSFKYIHAKQSLANRGSALTGPSQKKETLCRRKSIYTSHDSAHSKKVQLPGWIDTLGRSAPACS